MANIDALAKQVKVPSFVKREQETWDAMPEHERRAAVEIALGVTPAPTAGASAPVITPNDAAEPEILTQDGRVLAPATTAPPTVTPPPTPHAPAAVATRPTPSADGNLLLSSGKSLIELARLGIPPAQLPISQEDWNEMDPEGRAERIGILLEELNISMQDVKPSFSRMKMGRGGMTVWQTASGRAIDVLEGVIVWHSKARAWWKNKEITNSLPDCASLDGIVPHDEKGHPRKGPAVAGSPSTCAQCPYSQFGSDTKGGRGQDCKQVLNVFLWQEGLLVPLHVPLPPTSIKPFEAYITACVNTRPSRPVSTIITKFKLVPVKGPDGPYAVIDPEAGDEVPWQHTQVVRSIRQKFKDEMARRGFSETDVEVVDGDPAAGQPTRNENEDAPARGDREVPF